MYDYDRSVIGKQDQRQLRTLFKDNSDHFSWGWMVHLPYKMVGYSSGGAKPLLLPKLILVEILNPISQTVARYIHFRFN